MRDDTTTASTSKDTTDLTKKTRRLLAALRRWTPILAARSPATGALLGELAEDLEASLGGVLGADGKLYAERAETAALRGRRDDESGRLGEMLLGLRFSTLGQFREPDLTRLGFSQHTPREPDAQLVESSRLVTNFRSTELDEMLGESRFPTASFDGRIHAGHMEAQATTLRGLLVDVDAGQRQIAEALVEKREVTKKHKRLYLHTARIFEDLCRLAGKDGLADRVRSSERRRKSGGTGEAAGDVANDQRGESVRDRSAVVDRVGRIASRTRRSQALDVRDQLRSPPGAQLEDREAGVAGLFGGANDATLGSEIRAPRARGGPDG